MTIPAKRPSIDAINQSNKRRSTSPGHNQSTDAFCELIDQALVSSSSFSATLPLTNPSFDQYRSHSRSTSSMTSPSNRQSISQSIADSSDDGEEQPMQIDDALCPITKKLSDLSVRAGDIHQSQLCNSEPVYSASVQSPHSHIQSEQTNVHPSCPVLSSLESTSSLSSSSPSQSVAPHQTSTQTSPLPTKPRSKLKLPQLYEFLDAGMFGTSEGEVSKCQVTIDARPETNQPVQSKGFVEHAALCLHSPYLLDRIKCTVKAGYRDNPVDGVRVTSDSSIVYCTPHSFLKLNGIETSHTYDKGKIMIQTPHCGMLSLFDIREIYMKSGFSAGTAAKPHDHSKCKSCVGSHSSVSSAAQVKATPWSDQAVCENKTGSPKRQRPDKHAGTKDSCEKVSDHDDSQEEMNFSSSGAETDTSDLGSEAEADEPVAIEQLDVTSTETDTSDIGSEDEADEPITIEQLDDVETSLTPSDANTLNVTLASGLKIGQLIDFKQAGLSRRYDVELSNIERQVHTTGNSLSEAAIEQSDSKALQLRQAARQRCHDPLFGDLTDVLNANSVALKERNVIKSRIELLKLTVYYHSDPTKCGVTFDNDLSLSDWFKKFDDSVAPVFMPTKRRPDLAFLDLTAFGMSPKRIHAVVIESNEVNDYLPQLCKNHLVIVLDHCDRGIGFCRATIRSFVDIYQVPRFWMIDDNIQAFYSVNWETKKRDHVLMEEPLREAENQMRLNEIDANDKRVYPIAMIGFQSQRPRRKPVGPISYGTFVSTCVLTNTRFTGTAYYPTKCRSSKEDVEFHRQLTLAARSLYEKKGHDNDNSIGITAKLNKWEWRLIRHHEGGCGAVPELNEDKRTHGKSKVAAVGSPKNELSYSLTTASVTPRSKQTNQQTQLARLAHYISSLSANAVPPSHHRDSRTNHESVPAIVQPPYDWLPYFNEFNSKRVGSGIADLQQASSQSGSSVNQRQIAFDSQAMENIDWKNVCPEKTLLGQEWTPKAIIQVVNAKIGKYCTVGLRQIELQIAAYKEKQARRTVQREELRRELVLTRGSGENINNVCAKMKALDQACNDDSMHLNALERILTALKWVSEQVKESADQPTESELPKPVKIETITGRFAGNMKGQRKPHRGLSARRRLTVRQQY